MVQKFQSPVRVYKHPFELVMKVSVFVNHCQISFYFYIESVLFPWEIFTKKKNEKNLLVILLNVGF